MGLAPPLVVPAGRKKGIHLHHFPKDLSPKKLWIVQVEWLNWQPSPGNFFVWGKNDRLEAPMSDGRTPTNGGQRLQWTAVKDFKETAAWSSDEQRPDAPRRNCDWMLQWTTARSSNKWRPEALKNNGRRLQPTAVEDFEETVAWSSDERGPEAPRNRGRMFWQTAAGGSNERRLKISKKHRPEVSTNEGRRLRWMAAGGSEELAAGGSEELAAGGSKEMAAGSDVCRLEV